MASEQDWQYWRRLAKANAQMPSMHSPAPRSIEEAMNAVCEMRERMGGLREVITPQYKGDWGRTPPLHRRVQEAQGGARSGGHS